PLISSTDGNPLLILAIALAIYQSILIIFWQCLVLNGGNQIAHILLQFTVVFRGFFHSIMLASTRRSSTSPTVSISRRQSEERQTVTSTSN
ncbi:hypothetical protein PFISCL1PPCAC_9099, partial [Pristionchus fissidentatus]